MKDSGSTRPWICLLDPVVPHRRRRFQGLGDLTGIEGEVLSGLQLTDEHGRGPDPGEAVGLKLHPNREFVGLAGSCCCSSWTWSAVPSRFWTWCPISWERT